MRREYPPMLTGKPEDQIAQIRAYLVRLIGYLDEIFNSLPVSGTSEDEKAALSEWQKGIDGAVTSLRTAARQSPLIQYGSASTSGDVTFQKPYAEAPAVFSTAGAVSAVTAEGFSLTTSSAAKWIAVGTPARR